MKKHAWNNEWHRHSHDAHNLPGVESHLVDGRCFPGVRGSLAVALTPAALAQLRKAGGATHWLIPVEGVAMVKAAAALPGEVFWLSRRHPSEVLGQLDEAMRGAWLEADAVVVNLDGKPQRLTLPVEPAGKDALALLAQAVVSLWTGAPIRANHRQSLTCNPPQLALLAAA